MTDENKTHYLFITIKSGINKTIDEECVIFEQQQMGKIVHSGQPALRPLRDMDIVFDKFSNNRH